MSEGTGGIEDFLGVLGRLSIMERSLAQVMGRERFEFFILSDSNVESGETEKRAYLEMRDSFSRPVHYRRRALNIGRKPGNIAEWVTRFGGGYDHMIVLDADSIMNESHTHTYIHDDLHTTCTHTHT